MYKCDIPVYDLPGGGLRALPPPYITVNDINRLTLEGYTTLFKTVYSFKQNSKSMRYLGLKH